MPELAAMIGSSATGYGLFGALCLFLVVCFVRGWLYSKWQVQDQLKTRDDLIVQANIRAEDYKEAWDKAATGRDTALQQVTELLVVGQTANKVLASLPQLQMEEKA